MIVTNVLACLIYILSVVVILHKLPRYSVLFGYVSLIQVWTLVSCFYNDLGVYNFELAYETSTTLATMRLALFYIVFNAGFAVMGAIFKKSAIVRRDYRLVGRTVGLGNIKLAGYILIAAVVGYLGYSLVLQGIPLLKGIDRLTFYDASGRLHQLFVIYGGFIAFALGLLRVKRKGASVNGVILAGMLVYAVLVGNKFSFLAGILVGYYAAVFATFVHDRVDFSLVRAKYLLFSGIGIAAVLTLSLGFYLSERETVDAAQDLLLDRVFAGQGEIYWATDYEYFVNNERFVGHTITELNYLLGDETISTNDVGMRYLMTKILGPERSYLLFDRGYLFTMAYPAILLTVVPFWMSYLIQFVAGMFFCALLFYLHYAIVYRYRFRPILAMMIIIPYVTLLFTGNLFVFFTTGMLIKFLLLAGMEIPIFFERSRTS